MKHTSAIPSLEAEFDVSVGSGTMVFRLTPKLELTAGFLVLFGPSGAGKSLTLQTLAGLIRPRSGFLRVHGETLYDSTRRIDVPPHRRGIGYVPQHHALFPFRDVLDNVLFGVPRTERRRNNPRVLALMDELGIAHLAEARPGRLSGGERQRVALARALAVAPRLLLLDEPFASIDRVGAAALQNTLREVLDHHDVPTVLVTHDTEQARTLGDTLAVIENGRIVASGPPLTVLENPGLILVTGRKTRPAEHLDGGVVRVTLAQTTLTGPAAILGAPNQQDDDMLTLQLHATSRPVRSE